MKSIAKMLATALLGTLLTGASVVAQSVNIDYDHAVNLAKCKTYNIQKIHATDPDVESRITVALNRDLQARYLREDTKNPDLIITVVESNANADEYSNFYDSLGDLAWQRGWSSGFMDSSAAPANIPAGTLVLDMYDAKTHKLVWRGIATEPASVASSKGAGDKFDKAIGQMLNKFPPKYKKP